MEPTAMALTAGGATGTLTATVTVSPDNATNREVAWSSSDEKVATVANGVVTPVQAGTAIITATSVVDGTKTATSEVTVEEASVEPVTLESIAVKTAATKLLYTVGDTLDITGLVIEGTYSDGSKKDETITTANIIGFDSSVAVESQTLTVTVNGMTTTYTVEIKAAETHVAKIGEIKYDTLKEAVAAVKSGETINLVTDTSGDGIQVPSETNFTLDLGGFTYTVNGQLVGSTGTESQGFQLLKGSNITIKNGGLTTTNAKMLIQNYSNLTLDNVDLNGAEMTEYVLSNNNGATTLKNGTKITAVGDNVAFDVYYWPTAGYESVSVEILTNDVVIEGTVEYASDGTGDFEAKAALIIPLGYELDAPTGYEWVGQDGKQVLIVIQK